MTKVSISDLIQKKLKRSYKMLKSGKDIRFLEQDHVNVKLQNKNSYESFDDISVNGSDKTKNCIPENLYQSSNQSHVDCFLSEKQNNKIALSSFSTQQINQTTGCINNRETSLHTTDDIDVDIENRVLDDVALDKNNRNLDRINPFLKYTKRRRTNNTSKSEHPIATSFICKQKECQICNIDQLLPDDWRFFLKTEFDKRYFSQIKNALHCSDSFIPSVNRIFYFSELTRLKNLKAVILGQDPYHTPGKATGLAFAVSDGFKISPSLRVIYEELSIEYPDFETPKHGNLGYWAEQGVLLLNNILTVPKSMPLGHANIGWELFTTEILSKINNEFENIVFMLWGSSARLKGSIIDRSRHLVLEVDHPNSFGNSSFKNCQHFIRCNRYLEDHDKVPIDWQI